MITTLNEWKHVNEVNSNNVVYHGTTRKFTSFKINSEISTNTYGGTTDQALGIFFTDNIIMAKWFAGLIEYSLNYDKYVKTDNTNGQIISAKLNMKNPWILKDHIDDIDVDDPGQTYFQTVDSMGGGENMRKTLQEQGYDGVIVNNMNTNYYADGDYNIYVVFNTSDINVIK